MADSTPFLSHSNSTATEPKTPKTPKTPSGNSNERLPSLDSAINRLTGGFGWIQLFQVIIVALSWIFDGQQTFISIYTDAQPSWHCIDNTTCNPTSDICKLPKSAWAWDDRSDKTIISDFNLECASTFVSGLPASSFFMGCLIGGFTLATLGDTSLGRKNLLNLSLLTMCVAAFLTTFSTNVWIYSALRFLSGIGRASIGTCAVVLSTEMVASNLRGRVATIGGFCFTIGFVSLPAIAYLNRAYSWRILYVWTSIPGIFYVAIIHFFVLESPRWLILQGNKEEAEKTFERYAPGNHSGLNLLWTLNHMPSQDQTTQTQTQTSFYSTFKILFNRKWALKRLSIITLLAFGIGMVYYSMPLAVGNLGSDIYWSVVFNAFSEIPSLILYFFFVAKWNRRESLLLFSVLSGVCSIMCAVVSAQWTGVLIGLELVSFFSACVAFSVVIIFALELFPTNVRSLATSLARQALVLGAAFSPLLISAGRKNKIFSYGVFGVVITFCSFFVFLLPETKGIKLCDTMEEQESQDRRINIGLLV